MSLKILILTGAGISADSGIATFRDSDGLWEQHRIEDVATPEGFERNPGLVHEFYNTRRQGLASVVPNAAHKALAKLEAELPKPGEVFVVTQNIDDLHERGGQKNLLHMHGELLKARCVHCDTVSTCSQDLSMQTSCQNCGQKGGMRPHIVWFGEMPFGLDLIEQKLQEADLFVSIGSSGQVYPAAGFVSAARRLGIRTVELNLEPSTGQFDESYQGRAAEIVPNWVDQILSIAR